MSAMYMNYLICSTICDAKLLIFYVVTYGSRKLCCLLFVSDRTQEEY